MKTFQLVDLLDYCVGVFYRTEDLVALSVASERKHGDRKKAESEIAAERLHACKRVARFLGVALDEIISAYSASVHAYPEHRSIESPAFTFAAILEERGLVATVDDSKEAA